MCDPFAQMFLEFQDSADNVKISNVKIPHENS